MISDTNVATGSGGPSGETVRILTTFLCVILNAMVSVVIKHQNDLQEYMRILYQVLAVANMLLGISWSIWVTLWFSPDKTKEFCTIISMVFPFAYNVSYISVMACLCGVSFNLYLLVTRPLRYYTIVTRTRFYFTLTTTFFSDYLWLWDISTNSRVTLHKTLDGTLLGPRYKFKHEMDVYSSHRHSNSSCLCNTGHYINVEFPLTTHCA